MMMKSLRVGMFVLAITSTAPVAATESVSLEVSPAISFAPAEVRIRIRVEPNPANRVMTVVADSDSFYRSSTIQIDGDHAPLTTQLQFRGLPRGEYDITATVIGSDGKTKGLAHRRVNIVGAEPLQ
jgi:uncharacterized protein (DUF58 family)